jgi:sporulation protein YlmC with PRC-barrel domain
MAIKHKKLIGDPVDSKNGSIGALKDFLFDDRSWRIRYAVVDTSFWLPNRKVVLAPSSFSAHGLSSDGHLRVDLTKEQIEDSPKLEENLPISRQHESSLHSYFGWTPYWASMGPIAFPYADAPLSAAGVPYPINTAPEHVVHTDWAYLKKEREKNFDGHLRSLNEILGYKICTHDEEKFGQIENAIIDEKNWLVIDLIFNTHRWLPGGKEFVCSPLFVKKMDIKSKELHIQHDKDTILEAPELDFETYGSEYRKLLVEHYCNQDKALIGTQSRH